MIRWRFIPGLFFTWNTILFAVSRFSCALSWPIVPLVRSLRTLKVHPHFIRQAFHLNIDLHWVEGKAYPGSSAWRACNANPDFHHQIQLPDGDSATNIFFKCSNDYYWGLSALKSLDFLFTDITKVGENIRTTSISSFLVFVRSLKKTVFNLPPRLGQILISNIRLASESQLPLHSPVKHTLNLYSLRT